MAYQQCLRSTGCNQGKAALPVWLSTDVCIATHLCKNCMRTNTGGADEQGLEASEVYLVQQKPGDPSLVRPLPPAHGLPAEQQSR